MAYTTCRAVPFFWIRPGESSITIFDNMCINLVLAIGRHHRNGLIFEATLRKASDELYPEGKVKE